ncbi:MULTISPECIES: non-hydrolyzing UDP-N-acetylglucosamine 2-epimerase [Streptomyces]|uniref:UDP-N-acetylglucosamine 2-epimerase (Non-hydrolyzing) n=1 Tax=Streptomyces tsukubensis (strain DSM 42081 / NBRC 108919 / NRRL 18488 / 9993) TaxID=1114943 RepID=I2MY55_STRT9|nr:UDP-N-acetylglucosamine 2-epimerase (non-hydrolyzing) [Streptomyces tsukubensis]MYS62668.1 UDP-N-acetylglucosamine 2-epimerase (non-hydrolyzing) [Streptomyces sp. SID5473]AZK94043.1 UDP-N-acetylglucosamine 2-epimerase (non-hydrolyzing) [Streptomyces tsukubensis]EIF89702.1 UDP-N-acetylglucosamine 2-epimerase [Streptomyces tsukubensis NRRL18488]QKM69842.1 UDP-N-acetylglucosamine 2-epimerase (non-hydrolyzing) [Streptomyces tsukubensis NRRL18488]TAI46184.1 UDP-N-acetylglucosamine 2-epimerase (n
MKVLSVVGARPQLVKLAPIAAAFAGTDHEHVIVHTGQHYDADLSDVFFSGLGIPDPDVHLGVGSGSHGVQTGAVLAAMDKVLEEQRPDWVLVYGDTNSTVAGALSAVKMHLPVAHLEAGLRSFNRRMPEEHNRVLTDHCADLLLAPTEEAVRHLANEGLAERTRLSGDVMVDICLRIRDAVLAGEHPAPVLPEGIDPAQPFLLATLHRPDNTDDPARLAAIVESLAGLPVPVALLAHPRLVARAEEHGIELNQGSVHVGRPLPYAGLVAAVLASSGVVTDSGGLQKETFLLERACTTIRPETEWSETLEGGWNVLVPDPHLLDADAWAKTATRPAPGTERGTPYGDGTAARRVVELLAEAHEARTV